MAGRACLQALRRALAVQRTGPWQPIASNVAQGAHELSTLGISGCGRRLDSGASTSILFSRGAGHLMRGFSVHLGCFHVF